MRTNQEKIFQVCFCGKLTFSTWEIFHLKLLPRVLSFVLGLVHLSTTSFNQLPKEWFAPYFASLFFLFQKQRNKTGPNLTNAGDPLKNRNQRGAAWLRRKKTNVGILSRTSAVSWWLSKMKYASRTSGCMLEFSKTRCRSSLQPYIMHRPSCNSWASLSGRTSSIWSTSFVRKTTLSVCQPHYYACGGASKHN